MTRMSSFRYAFVAGLSLLIHNLVIISADAIALPLFAGVLASFSVVVIVGYLLHSRLTFVEPLSWRRFERYAVAMAVNIPASFIMIWLWNVAAGLAMVYASPIATLCMLIVNYLLSRWAIVAPAQFKRDIK
ncbi:MAG: GtrA family protein [Sphingopyxis sp.]